MTTNINQLQKLRACTRNSIKYINEINKIFTQYIRKIDSILLRINNELIKIQPTYYGRVELYFSELEIAFLIRQKLSNIKDKNNSNFTYRYYSICKNNVLQKLQKKPQYITLKDKIKPLILNAKELIKIRKEIINGKYSVKKLDKINLIEKRVNENF